MSVITDKEVCKVLCKAEKIVKKRGGCKGNLVDEEGRCCAEGAVALACGVPERSLVSQSVVAWDVSSRTPYRNVAVKIIEIIDTRVGSLTAHNDGSLGTKRTIAKAKKAFCTKKGRGK